MYLKNLKCDFRLRLTQEDMEYLVKLSNERKVSVSEIVRTMISDYRRKFMGAVHGDTKTDFNNII